MTQPARYRVKNAEVDALQRTGQNVAEMQAFAADDFSVEPLRGQPSQDEPEPAVSVWTSTFAWEVLAEGDWVLRGPHGLFVVGAAAFADGYEPITAEVSARAEQAGASS